MFKDKRALEALNRLYDTFSKFGITVEETKAAIEKFALKSLKSLDVEKAREEIRNFLKPPVDKEDQ